MICPYELVCKDSGKGRHKIGFIECIFFPKWDCAIMSEVSGCGWSKEKHVGCEEDRSTCPKGLFMCKASRYLMSMCAKSG